MNGTTGIVVGAAFVATCIWLGVRIVNRRERWAKWTLATGVGVPVLYVASFGPACWITGRTNSGTSALETIYKPITLAMSPNNETILSRLIMWYAQIGAPVDSYWIWTEHVVNYSDGTTDQSAEWSWVAEPPSRPRSPAAALIFVRGDRGDQGTGA